MAPDAAAQSYPSVAEQKPAAERVRMLYQHAPAGFIATLTNASLVVYGMWSEAEKVELLAWLAWVVVLTAGRFSLYKIYLRRSPGPEQSRQWERWFAFGTGVAGLTWGALGTVLFPVQNLLHQMLVIFVVGGMATGATGLLGSSRMAFYSFFAPSLPPLAAQLLLQGGTVYLVMGVMLALFTGMLVVIFQRFHSHVLATIHIRFENDSLLESLHRARDEIQEANEKMTSALSEQLLILETVTVGVAFMKDQRILRNNTRLDQIFGCEAGEMIGQSTHRWFSCDEEWRQVGEKAYGDLAQGKTVEEERIMLKHDGTPFWCHFAGQAVDPADLSKGAIWVYQDVTGRKRIEQALKESEGHYRNLVETSNDLIWALDREGRWTYLNPNATWRIYGCAPAEMLGRPFADFEPAERRQRDAAAFQRVLAGDSIYQHETVHFRKDGTPVVLSFNAAPARDALGNIVGTTGTASDITERKHSEERVWHLAHHDALTNLPNRRLFQDRLAQALIQASRKSRRVALLLLDLDRFKPVNDTYGHATGDKILQAVAERLRLCVRQSDTVSRQGGDEFAVILPEISGGEDAAMIAEKILHSIAQPIAVPDNEVHLSVSIGVAMYPADAEDAETLLKQADAAMYRAKEKGRNNCQFARGQPFRRDPNDVREPEPSTLEIRRSR